MRNIPFFKPDIQIQDISSVSSIIETGMLVQGKEVQQLEQHFQEKTKANYAVALSNGTATLHVMLKSAGVKEGDEVIVPAFSYTATANAVELCGATPIFIDIDLDSFNIQVEKIKEKINKNTQGILVVHEFGMPAEMNPLQTLCKEHGLQLWEDAACALGSYYQNKHVGTFGQAGSFSLHPRKAITSGEGGILITHDENLFRKYQSLRNHGLDSESETMNFIEAGFNYRMTDFQAALVNSQFNRLEQQLERKAAIAEYYLTQLKENKFLLPKKPKEGKHSWQTFHLLFHSIDTRNKAMQELRSIGIGCGPGAQCMPAQTYYFNKYRMNAPQLFPNAWKSQEAGLAIPLYSKLEELDLMYITDKINAL